LRSAIRQRGVDGGTLETTAPLSDDPLPGQLARSGGSIDPV
jgi:hypothetical protein